MPFTQLPDTIRTRIAAFSIVGVVNTVLGVCVIVLSRLLGASPILANILGYATGLVVSFSLNSRITFGRRSVDRYVVGRFLTSFVVAFLLNIVTVALVTDIAGSRGLLASLAGVPIFTIVFYVLCEWWVFRKSA